MATVERRIQRRRDRTPEDLLADRQVTRHQLEILKRMRDTGAPIFLDDELCVLLFSTHQRKIKHNCVAALRALRFIRPMDNDKTRLVLTWRGKEALKLKGL